MYRYFIKRLLDIIISLLVLIIFSPLLIVLTIVVTINMKGNPFFVQSRPGYKERIFKLIKYRSMTNERDKDGRLLSDEIRLTKFGKWLRSTSLDELPEFINILKGDMSLIGPRPQLVKDMVFMSNEQRKRHTVKPGLSGLAQIKGRNNISWEGKLSTDLEYIKDISFINDLKIAFITIGKIIKKEDINQEEFATAEDLGDYLLRTNKITEKEYYEKINIVELLLENRLC